MILLATMMIPWDVTMIPQYMEFNLFGWINTLLPLIVPTWFGSAYYVFLMRQFLMGIPKDYEEAARLDGANAFQIYWKNFHADPEAMLDYGGGTQHADRME